MWEVVEPFLQHKCTKVGLFELGDGLTGEVFMNKDAHTLFNESNTSKDIAKNMLVVIKLQAELAGELAGMCYLARFVTDQKLHVWGVFARTAPIRRFDRVLNCPTLPSIDDIVQIVREEWERK